MAIVDLSFPIRKHFRWKVAPEQVATHANGDPLQSTVVTISCHAYTHVDAPLHYLPDGRDIATMPVDQWIGQAAVVDLSHLGANGEVTAAELERHGAHVRRGDIVLLRTDWPRRASVDTPRFWQEGPFTGTTGCEWLVARGVKAVGYDYPPDHCIRDRSPCRGADPTGRIHDSRHLLSRRHHGDRVPDQPEPDRRGAVPVPGSSPRAGGSGWLARASHRRDGLG
ncbi:MAG TPA: cyclase family protein [Candidatus Methylomirabilis sp.]|nr:cyclase family protein [Candidatus Methylomirabilis sp.]